MEIETKQLRPGMVLLDDVNGRNGKPIVPKNTELTNLEIEFIEKFLIKRVNVSQPKVEQSKRMKAYNKAQQRNAAEQVELTTEEEKTVKQVDSFTKIFTEVVGQYKTLYSSWQANIPVNMYHVRQLCMPLFELVETKSLNDIKALVAGRERDLFHYKVVTVSLFAIKLAQKLNFERKDWLQIGFAAILIDLGLTKSKPVVDSETADVRHPIISYEMIKDEPTLTKNAKIAILQHHERLDGTGFPLKITAEKIIPYSRIITIADRYISQYVQHGDAVITILRSQANQYDQKIVQLID